MKVAVGRLSSNDLIALIRDCGEPNLREKFAEWLLLLNNDKLDGISKPRELVIYIDAKV